jgi:polar amino acid transport system substrate-binding protein
MLRITKAVVGVASTAVLALSMAACGDDSNDSGSGGGTSTGGPSAATSVDAALAGKVPDAVKSDGKIVVGSDASYAPNEFLADDGKTIQGFDVDLFTAVAAKLGLTAEFTNAKFGEIIAGVDTGKYEVGVSSFTINAERTKDHLMVSYFSAGTQWATKQGNSAGVDPNNACGKKIAVQKDTVQETDDLPKRQQACKDAGKPAITVDSYVGQDQATTSVVSGKDDAMLADSPIIAYAVKKSNGQLETLGDIYDSAPYGYVAKKADQGLAEAIQGALQQLISDGSYKQILDRWGVAAGAITTPEINPAS